MKKANFILATGLFLCGCATTCTDKDTVFQASTMESLLRGLYDTDIVYSVVKQHGDFGLGTFQALDGEMVALEGRFYQVKADGLVYPVSDYEKCGFATVKFFKPDTTASITVFLDYEGLKKYLDSLLLSKNTIYAIRIDGKFSYLKARSVASQLRPYPGLTEAIKKEAIFEFKDTEATLVGFRFPAYMGKLNASGYHFHVISKDMKRGGHLLDCIVLSGKIKIDKSSNFMLRLSQDKDFLSADFLSPVASSINKVE
jgi:acetolactate decarboxylase